MMRLNKEGQLLRVFLLSLLTSIVTIALYAFVENETISAIFLRIACPAVICCLVTGLFLLATVLARPFKGIPEAKWAVSLVLEALTAMPFAVAAIRDSQSSGMFAGLGTALILIFVAPFFAVLIIGTAATFFMTRARRKRDEYKDGGAPHTEPD